MQKRKSPDWREIQEEWYSKLGQDGFVDIEDRKGNLKTHDRRTIGWEHRELIAQYFRELDHFLTHETTLSEVHRLILSLYSEGEYIQTIAQLAGRSIRQVRNVITAYKTAWIAAFPPLHRADESDEL